MENMRIMQLEAQEEANVDQGAADLQENERSGSKPMLHKIYSWLTWIWTNCFKSNVKLIGIWSFLILLNILVMVLEYVFGINDNFVLIWTKRNFWTTYIHPMIPKSVSGFIKKCTVIALAVSQLEGQIGKLLTIALYVIQLIAKGIVRFIFAIPEGTTSSDLTFYAIANIIAIVRRRNALPQPYVQIGIFAILIIIDCIAAIMDGHWMFILTEMVLAQLLWFFQVDDAGPSSICGSV